MYLLSMTSSPFTSEMVQELGTLVASVYAMPMGLSLITDAGQNFEQIIWTGTVKSILADVFKPEDAFFLDDINGRDVLIDFQLCQLGMLVVAHIAPVVLSRQASGEYEKDIFSCKLRYADLTSLVEWQAEIRHGLQHGDGLDLSRKRYFD